MPYVWVLRCPNCKASFAPTEEDWDGEIECPRCGLVDVVDHDSYDGPAEPLLTAAPKPPEVV